MTDEELVAEVKRHWEHWAGHLGITNWWISFEGKKKTKDYNMEILFNQEGYLRATILVANNPIDWWHYGIEFNVLHETLHVLYHQPSRFVKHSLSSELYGEFLQFEEAHVDALTSIIWRLHEQTGCKL